MTRRWAAVLLLTVFTSLAAGGIYSLSNLARANEWVKHSDEVRVAVGQLLTTLMEAETGVRGYAVAGEPVFLVPYTRAQASWSWAFARVHELTVDSPGQQTRLARLEPLLRKRFELLAQLTERRAAGQSGAQLTAAMLAGKRVIDEVQRVLDDIDAEESALSELRGETAARRWRWTMGLFVAGAVVFLVIVVAIWLQRREAEARRERAEEIARANELFRLVLQGTDAGITVQDRTGKIVYANQTAANVIGFASPEEVIAATVGQIEERFDVRDLDGHPLPKERMPYHAALVGQPTDELPLRFKIHRESEERWSLMRAIPVRDLNGEVIYAINFFREVTAEVREKHQRAFLLRVQDELTSSLDYERTLATVAGLTVPVLADWCAIDIIDDGAPKRLATSPVEPDRRDPNCYIAVPLKLRDRVIGVLTMVMAESGRRYTERDLELAQSLADRAALAIEKARLFRDAEAQSRFAETFVGILGHDLRNPLNAISMAASLLKRRNQGDPKPIDRILVSAQRMSSMVAQLLDLTRSRIGGGIPIEKCATDLAAVAATAIEELQLVHPGREVRFQCVDGQWGNWDRDRLAQVVSNLVGNALEHGDPARAITVRLGGPGDSVQLMVHSFGPVIPPGVLPNIFDPYRRSAVRSERSKGLGLGLYITQQIVLAHGGSITCSSTHEEGTTFTVILPRGAEQDLGAPSMSLL
jgi:PAS domain S-box-containing protein